MVRVMIHGDGDIMLPTCRFNGSSGRSSTIPFIGPIPTIISSITQPDTVHTDTITTSKLITTTRTALFIRLVTTVILFVTSPSWINTFTACTSKLSRETLALKHWKCGWWWCCCKQQRWIWQIQIELVIWTERCDFCFRIRLLEGNKRLL